MAGEKVSALSQDRLTPWELREAAHRRLLRLEASGPGPFGGPTLTGLEHVRFHDLRHTAATRMIQGGMPIAEVGRLPGHTDLTRLVMTYRYIGTDDTTLSRAAAILDACNVNAAADLSPHDSTAVN